MCLYRDVPFRVLLYPLYHLADDALIYAPLRLYIEQTLVANLGATLHCPLQILLGLDDNL